MVIAIQKLQQNKKKYDIEYSVYKDVNWFRGWYRNLKPHWSEWKLFDSFNSLKVINIIISDLKEKNAKINHKIAYRIINRGLINKEILNEVDKK